MELQIQDLLQSIKKEGVDTAKAEADVIVREAREKAATIVREADEQADGMKERAKKEIAVMRESAKADAMQARRDAVLSFKNEIQNEYEKILSSRIKDALDDKALSALIRAAVAGEDISGYAAEVATVTDELKTQLADEIKNGLEIRPSRSVKAGFRLAKKDGSGFFDCSDDEIMQMLMPYFKDLEI